MCLNDSSPMELSHLAWWTDDPSRTWSPPTSTASPSIISSLALEPGQSPPASPDTLTTASCGPAPARARAKASPANGSEPMIQGICGRTFFASSALAGQPSLLASRLQQRLARIGSTESALIWSVKTTPGKRSIFRLAPSTRLTNGSDCTGSRWPTAAARDWRSDRSQLTSTELYGTKGRPLSRTMLEMSGEISFNPTPRASDGEKGGPNMSFGAGGMPLPAVMHSFNPTPTVADVEGGRKHRSGARAGEPLLNGLLAAYAPTPTSLSFADSHQPGNSRSSNLLRAHFETALSGPTTNGSSAPSTAKRGAPNPEFPFWLMGFPDALICGVLQAMQSFRRSRQKFSKPISKPSKAYIIPPPCGAP